MERLSLIILSLLLNYSNIEGQLFTNFDSFNEISINIEGDSFLIWQIGKPEKSNFSQAFSSPNALITDTVQSYGINLTERFTFEINTDDVWAGFPFFILSWFQKIDTDDSKDGGFIEVSYDEQESWINIFKDTANNPLVFNVSDTAKLKNGLIGFTGVSDNWKEIQLCWSKSDFDFNIDRIWLRFTFISDSIETNQDGWMIDNLSAYPTIVDNIIEEDGRGFSTKVEINNLVVDDMKIRIKNKNIIRARVQLFDLQGRIIMENQFEFLGGEKSMDLSDIKSGMYIVVLRIENEILSKRVLKI